MPPPTTQLVALVPQVVCGIVTNSGMNVIEYGWSSRVRLKLPRLRVGLPVGL